MFRLFPRPPSSGTILVEFTEENIETIVSLLFATPFMLVDNLNENLEMINNSSFAVSFYTQLMEYIFNASFDKIYLTCEFPLPAA